MTTVAVCDTEPILIEGLRSLLESAESLRVVAAESSLEDGMDAVRELKPSILVIDKNFGLHALGELLVKLEGAPKRVGTIVWGHNFSEAECVRLVQAGALGVLRKTSSLDTVLECLGAVQRGGSWVCGDEARDYRGRRSGHSPLTSRESQVMDLVEQGMKNKEIAQALGIRVGTVKIHLKHVFEKTGIRGRYGLALSGLKQKGLLTGIPSIV